jgi:probable phosphoglycerate mutase
MKDFEPKTRFGLIRHARTVWNQAKRIQGQSDSPLIPDGEKQAKQWGPILKEHQWDRILASDLGRALQTAALVNDALKLAIQTDSRLREQNWGNWTGKTLAQVKIKALRHLEDHVQSGWRFCPPGGEDRNSVWLRSQTALLEAAKNQPGATMLVITHEGVIKSLIYRLCNRQFLPSEPPLIRPLHLHWLVYDRSGLRVEKINALALPSYTHAEVMK